MQNKKTGQSLPDVQELKAELKRVNYQQRYYRVLKSTIYTLLVVAAVSVLLATLFFPVLRIYGNSMAPTLQEGEIIVTLKGTDFESGDLVAFYLGNRLLIKRCIAGPGQWVNIDEAGNIYVDDMLLQEPYIEEKALGECNIELPYQVPEDMWFLVGDHRATSVDSRNTSVGCISKEQVVGRAVYRVWPLGKMGKLNN